jgi:nucleotide-binding universal stress UspA family protein
VSGARRVIVGASGSPGSLRALRHAEDLARHGVATLIPVLAWTPPGGDVAARRQPCPTTLIDLWQEAAWQRLWAALEAAWGEIPADLAVQPVVQRGQPGQVLVEVACHPDDLLVVGTGRRGALARLCCARVGRYCLAHAQCPVVAVPPGALAQEAGRGLHGWPFRRRSASMDRFLRDGGSVTA